MTADERAILRRRPGRAAPRPCTRATRCSSGGRRRAGDRGSFRTISSGSSDQRSIDDQAAVERQRLGAAVQHGDRRQPALVDAAHQDRRHLRVQRLVDLVDDHRREIGRVGLEAHPAGERQQDLPRVVLLAEEPLVEPVPRALAVAERRRREATISSDVEPELLVTISRSVRSRSCTSERTSASAGQEARAPSACGSRARTAGCAAAPRAGRARAPRRPRRRARTPAAAPAPARTTVTAPGYSGAVHADEHRDDRHAVLDRIGEHARHGGVDRHADPAPLVRVVVEPVAIDALDDARATLIAERRGERARSRRRDAWRPTPRRSRADSTPARYSAVIRPGRASAPPPGTAPRAATGWRSSSGDGSGSRGSPAR